jgi:hypothetical protein
MTYTGACAHDRDRWADATAPDYDASTICRTVCPIRLQCLETALRCHEGGKEVHGIIGGIFVPPRNGWYSYTHFIGRLYIMYNFLKDQQKAVA